MFAKRRPKPQDQDEEPLVPHGLIWQATDEREKPEIIESKAASGSALPNDARMDSPQDAPAISPSVKKPVSSAPIAWPGNPAIPATANIAGSDAPARPRPVLVQPAGTVRNQESQRPAKLRLAAESALTKFLKFSSARRSDVIRLSNNCRETGALARTRAGKSLSLAQTDLMERYHRADLNTRFVRTKDLAFASVHRMYLQTYTWSKELKVRVAPWLASLIANARAKAKQIGEARVKVRLKAPSFPEQWSLTPPTDQVKQLPYRFRIALAQIRAEWMLKRQGVERDSRFWASMSMAALCAVLALGFTAAVRHYATKALPSNQVFREEPARVAPAIVKPVSSESRKQSAVHVPKRSSPPATVQKTANKGRKELKPARRRSVDDDFVARDTYVYYGNRPSSH